MVVSLLLTAFWSPPSCVDVCARCPSSASTSALTRAALAIVSTWTLVAPSFLALFTASLTMLDVCVLPLAMRASYLATGKTLLPPLPHLLCSSLTSGRVLVPSVTSRLLLCVLMVVGSLFLPILRNSAVSSSRALRSVRRVSLSRIRLLSASGALVLPRRACFLLPPIFRCASIHMRFFTPTGYIIASLTLLVMSGLPLRCSPDSVRICASSVLLAVLPLFSALRRTALKLLLKRS